jgi:hypothetical protein
VADSAENKGLENRVQNLEEWRRSIVDPMLEEHDQKLQAFERIEMQVTGAIKFFKFVGGVVGFIAAIVEITRFALMMEHVIH